MEHPSLIPKSSNDIAGIRKKINAPHRYYLDDVQVLLFRPRFVAAPRLQIRRGPRAKATEAAGAGNGTAVRITLSSSRPSLSLHAGAGLPVGQDDRKRSCMPASCDWTMKI